MEETVYCTCGKELELVTINGRDPVYKPCKYCVKAAVMFYLKTPEDKD